MRKIIRTRKVKKKKSRSIDAQIKKLQNSSKNDVRTENQSPTTSSLSNSSSRYSMQYEEACGSSKSDQVPPPVKQRLESRDSDNDFYIAPLTNSVPKNKKTMKPVSTETQKQTCKKKSIKSVPKVSPEEIPRVPVIYKVPNVCPVVPKSPESKLKLKNKIIEKKTKDFLMQTSSENVAEGKTQTSRDKLKKILLSTSKSSDCPTAELTMKAKEFLTQINSESVAEEKTQTNRDKIKKILSSTSKSNDSPTAEPTVAELTEVLDQHEMKAKSMLKEAGITHFEADPSSMCETIKTIIGVIRPDITVPKTLDPTRVEADIAEIKRQFAEAEKKEKFKLSGINNGQKEINKIVNATEHLSINEEATFKSRKKRVNKGISSMCADVATNVNSSANEIFDCKNDLEVETVESIKAKGEKNAMVTVAKNTNIGDKVKVEKGTESKTDEKLNVDIAKNQKIITKNKKGIKTKKKIVSDVLVTNVIDKVKVESQNVIEPKTNDEAVINAVTSSKPRVFTKAEKKAIYFDTVERPNMSKEVMSKSEKNLNAENIATNATNIPKISDEVMFKSRRGIVPKIRKNLSLNDTVEILRRKMEERRGNDIEDFPVLSKSTPDAKQKVEVPNLTANFSKDEDLDLSSDIAKVTASAIAVSKCQKKEEVKKTNVLVPKQFSFVLDNEEIMKGVMNYINGRVSKCPKQVSTNNKSLSAESSVSSKEDGTNPADPQPDDGTDERKKELISRTTGRILTEDPENLEKKICDKEKRIADSEGRPDMTAFIQFLKPKARTAMFINNYDIEQAVNTIDFDEAIAQFKESENEKLKKELQSNGDDEVSQYGNHEIIDVRDINENNLKKSVEENNNFNKAEAAVIEDSENDESDLSERVHVDYSDDESITSLSEADECDFEDKNAEKNDALSSDDDEFVNLDLNNSNNHVNGISKSIEGYKLNDQDKDFLHDKLAAMLGACVLNNNEKFKLKKDVMDSDESFEKIDLVFQDEESIEHEVKDVIPNKKPKLSHDFDNVPEQYRFGYLIDGKFIHNFDEQPNTVSTEDYVVVGNEESFEGKQELAGDFQNNFDGELLYTDDMSKPSTSSSVDGVLNSVPAQTRRPMSVFEFNTYCYISYLKTFRFRKPGLAFINNRVPQMWSGLTPLYVKSDVIGQNLITHNPELIQVFDRCKNYNTLQFPCNYIITLGRFIAKKEPFNLNEVVVVAFAETLVSRELRKFITSEEAKEEFTRAVRALLSPEAKEYNIPDAKEYEDLIKRSSMSKEFADRVGPLSNPNFFNDLDAMFYFVTFIAMTRRYCHYSVLDLHFMCLMLVKREGYVSDTLMLEMVESISLHCPGIHISNVQIGMYYQRYGHSTLIHTVLSKVDYCKERFNEEFDNLRIIKTIPNSNLTCFVTVGKALKFFMDFPWSSVMLMSKKEWHNYTLAAINLNGGENIQFPCIYTSNHMNYPHLVYAAKEILIRIGHESTLQYYPAWTDLIIKHKAEIDMLIDKYIEYKVNGDDSILKVEIMTVRESREYDSLMNLVNGYVFMNIFNPNDFDCDLISFRPSKVYTHEDLLSERYDVLMKLKFFSCPHENSDMFDEDEYADDSDDQYEDIECQSI